MGRVARATRPGDRAGERMVRPPDLIVTWTGPARVDEPVVEIAHAKSLGGSIMGFWNGRVTFTRYRVGGESPLPFGDEILEQARRI